MSWRAAVEPWLPALVGVWLLGVLLLSVWNLGGWAVSQRLRTLDAEPLFLPASERLARSLGLRRSVKLLRSPRVDTPLTLGWLKPVVLFPPAALLGLTPAQLEAVLAHELAHIRRHDYLANLMQVCVETLLFYHPAVWWISARIRAEREHCCDDLAVRACVGDAVAYAEALAALEASRRDEGVRPALALAARGKRGQGHLLSRVARLLNPGDHERARVSRSAGGMMTAAAVIAIFAAFTLRAWGSADQAAIPAVGETIVGRLVDPAGNPVDGAEVIVGTSKRHLSLDGSKSRIPDVVSMATNSGGRFWVRSEGLPFGVVIFHKTGFAAASHESLLRGEKVKLQPWARVEGVALEGQTPVPGVMMTIEGTFRAGAAQVIFQLATRSDAQGRFAFERVPPIQGALSVGRFIEIVRGYSGVAAHDHTVPIDPRPGDRLSVRVGGEGATLSGRVLAAGGQPLQATKVFAYGSLSPALLLNGDPPDITRSAEAIARERRTTDEQLKARDLKRDDFTGGRYAVLLQDDGTFRVADVRPGRYRLEIRVTQLVPQPPWGMGADIGWVNQNIIVVPGQAAVELGDLPLVPPSIQPATKPGAMRGRVVDEGGSPVAAAKVEPYGARLGDRAWFGPTQAPEVQTDALGEFEIPLGEPYTALSVIVTAKELAPRNLLNLSPERFQEITLTRGTTVKGRLVSQEGQPIPGVQVGLIQEHRGVETYVGRPRATTDQDGRFTFTHITPRERWIAHGVMASLKTLGAAEPKVFETPIDGAEVDLGEIRLGRAVRLSGRVVLDDDRPVPAGTKVYLSQEDVSDTQTAVLDEQGAFAFEGLRPGLFELQVRVKGYRLSTRNRSRDPGNRSLLGLIRTDVTDLRVLLEPGSEGDVFHAAPPEVSRALRESELRGVTDGADAAAPLQKPSDTINFSGRIVDDRGRPIPRVEVRVIAYAPDPPEGGFRPFHWTMAKSGQLGIQRFVAKWVPTKTDDDGRFKAEGLPADRPIDLAYWSDLVPQTRRQGMEKLPPQERENLTLIVPASAWVSGRLNRETMPVIEHIEMVSANDASAVTTIYVKPDQTSYQFPALAAGEYLLLVGGPSVASASGPGFFTPSISVQHVTLKEGEERKIDIGSGPMPAVAGRILNGKRPMANGTVVLRLEGDRPAWVYLFGKTDEQGRFLFPHVSPGRYAVLPLGTERPDAFRVRRADADQTITVDTQDIQRDFVFGAAATVRGQVINPRVNLLLTQTDGPELKSAWTRSLSEHSDISPDGRFSFSGVPAGTYSLTEHVGSKELLLCQGIQVRDDQDTDLGRVERRGGTITVEIQGIPATGPDRFGVTVRRVGDQAEARGLGLASDVLQAGQSRVALGRVLEGPAEVTVHSLAYVMKGEPRTVEVTHGKADTVKVEVEPVTWASVHTPDRTTQLASATARNEATGETIELTREEPFRSATRRLARFDAYGAQLRGVEAGPWTLTVKTTDGRSWSKRFELRPGEALQEAIRLEPAASPAPPDP